MKQFILSLFVLSSILSLAQKATISGTVTDKDMNNEPLPFANVIVKGTKSGTTTDEKGNYSISVEPGNLNVEFSFLGYETVVVPVVIKAGQTLKLNQILGSGEGVSLQDVVIATSRRKNTESALVTEMKEAKQVISAISAEQMSKGTDSNAAQAIQRVPGVTIVDGKYVIIRGLPERYNNVLINNAIAPSTEVDRRTFSFDLVPTNALEKMVINKSGSANKPGDFAGGVIELTTSENTSEYTKYSVSAGYRTNTTFENQTHSQKSDTDFLGFDNGLRALPANFPSTAQMKDSGNQSELRLNAGQSLANNWAPIEYSTFLNTSTGFGLGRNIKIGNKKIYTNNSVSYSNSHQSYPRLFAELGNNQGTSEINKLFNDEVFEQETRINALSNWFINFNDRNKLKFKNLFNQIGETETRLRSGSDFQQGFDYKAYQFSFKSRSILASQLEGEHKFGESQKLDWVLGYNYLYEDQPDLRRFRQQKNRSNPSENFALTNPAAPNLFDNSRFFGKLKEFSATNGLNYTYKLNRDNAEEEFEPYVLKAGYLVDYKYRIFKSRYGSFALHSDNRALREAPLNEAFAQQNIGQNFGWYFAEGTSPTDSYKADNFLTAGYLMAEIPYKKFDITAGLRVENNNLRLRNFDNNFNYIKTDINQLSFLPSVNVGYAISETHQIRGGYSRTVNRPEFREIAPFLFFDFVMNAPKFGNPNLTNATINNIDIRYEIYPRKGEVASIGGFYKTFQNPIESVLLNFNENRGFGYQNAESARSYGVEVEFKKSFKDFIKVPFIEDLAINLNAAYIFSEVDLGATAGGFQDRTRPMQGQSPYIVNANLEYTNAKGWTSNLIYNRFGSRIFAVGSNNAATIYEAARDQLDFSISKAFKKINLKLAVQNILDAKFNFFDDTNNNYRVDNTDVLTSSFQRGILFNLGLTYDF